MLLFSLWHQDDHSGQVTDENGTEIAADPLSELPLSEASGSPLPTSPDIVCDQPSTGSPFKSATPKTYLKINQAVQQSSVISKPENAAVNSNLSSTEIYVTRTTESGTVLIRE